MACREYPLNCLLDGVLQDTGTKEKARRRIAAAGLQAPATLGSHWVTPQSSSYPLFVPFQLDQSTSFPIRSHDPIKSCFPSLLRSLRARLPILTPLSSLPSRERLHPRDNVE